jgi:hypothetical protein
MAQMVRGTAQDGTEESWYVDTCSFNGGGKTFTSGVIDLTGINDRTHIYDATIYNYKSTVGGIYSTTAGTKGRGSGHLEIKNVWLDPGLSNSGSTCLLLDTSASTVAFTEEIILDGIECQNSTAKYPIEFRNTNTPVSPTMRGIWAKHVTIEGTSAATSQLYLNGVNDSHFEDIFCDGTAINCVDIANTKNNYAISIFDIEAPISGLTNTLIDRLNNFTIAQSGALGTSHVQHYTVAGTASLGANYSRWYQTTPLVVTGLKLADQGQCQMVSGACSAQSLSHTYASAPNCVATWTGKGTLTNGGLKIASTTTTVTPSSSTNTDTAVVNWVCFGN